MILLIPSIELVDGESASIIKSDSEATNMYDKLSRDPMELSMLWRKENAKCLHLIDQDSFAGNNNFMNLNSILYLLNAVDIPLQFASNFENVDECRMLLSNGIYRVALSELAMTDPAGVSKLIDDFTPSRVAFQANVENNFIFFRNAKKQIRDSEFAKQVKSVGGNRIIYTSESWTESNEKPDYAYLKEFAEENDLKLTILNGIRNADDLIELNELNEPKIDSCIVGKPLYENKFPCQAIWRLAESEVPFNK